MKGPVVEACLVKRRSDGSIARLTLDHPKRANVLSSAMIEALIEALSEAWEDSAIRVIILQATGRVFSAGHDLGELRADEDPARHLRLFQRCADLMLAIGDSPKPVIA